MKLTIAFIVLLVLAACTSDIAPTSAPTSAPTATSVPSATATSTPVPTATPTHPAYPLPTTPAPMQTVSPTALPTIPAELLNRNYHVLFLRDKHIWSVDLEGKNLQRVTPDGFTHEGFGFEQTVLSPDKQFVPVYNQPMGTWVLKLNDQARFQVSKEGVYPVWAPDSRAIVYSESGNIYVREFERWDQPRFISTGFFPTWSPDGKWIAYLTATAGTSEVSQTRHLHLAHPDGTGLQEIDSFEVGNRGGGSLELQWSFDGHYLLAWGQKPNAARLWSIDASGNRLFAMQAVNMMLSPSGPYLLLEDREAIEDRIITLTTPLKERTEKSNRCDWGSLAFNGKHLACIPSSYAMYERNTLFVIDLESGQTTKLYFSLQSWATLHWMSDDALVVSKHTEQNTDELWLVGTTSNQQPRLITQGVFIGTYTAK